MTREEIIEQLAATSGPFSPDRIGELPNDPAIIEVVRELLRLPWPDEEDDEGARVYAPIVAGLLRDEASARPLVALLLEAESRGWDTVCEGCFVAAGAIGGAMVEPLLDEIERIEARADPATLATAPIDSQEYVSFHQYWGLVTALGEAGGDPSTHALIEPVAIERLGRFDLLPAFDDTEVGPLEIWLDFACEVGTERLRSAAADTLRRYPEGFRTELFGDEADYWRSWKTADRRPAREKLVAKYRRLIELAAEWEREEEERDATTADEWLGRLRAGERPFDRACVRTLETTPALLEALRTALTPPWPDEDDPIARNAPVAAAILLGLHGDASDAERLIDAAVAAREPLWEAMLETVPYCIAALGPAALPALLRGLDRLEESIDESGAIPGESTYLTLLEALTLVARLHPETHDELAAIAIERIADARHDRPHRRLGDTFEEQLAHMAERPTRSEVWVMAAGEIDRPDVDEAICAFFARQDPEYHSPFAGTLAYYRKREPVRMTRRELRRKLFEDYDWCFEEGAAPEPRRASADDGPDLTGTLDALYGGAALGRSEPSQRPILRETPKVGRNDPCPCGSGKKYKKCHGM